MDTSNRRKATSTPSTLSLSTHRDHLGGRPCSRPYLHIKKGLRGFAQNDGKNDGQDDGHPRCLEQRRREVDHSRSPASRSRSRFGHDHGVSIDFHYRYRDFMKTNLVLGIIALMALAGCGDTSVETSAGSEASGPKPAAEWYVLAQQTRIGPMNEDRLRREAAKGRLRSDEQVWSPALDGWSSISSVIPDIEIGGTEEAGTAWAGISRKTERVPEPLIPGDRRSMELTPSSRSTPISPRADSCLTECGNSRAAMGRNPCLIPASGSAASRTAESWLACSGTT